MKRFQAANQMPDSICGSSTRVRRVGFKMFEIGHHYKEAALLEDRPCCDISSHVKQMTEAEVMTTSLQAFWTLLKTPLQWPMAPAMTTGAQKFYENHFAKPFVPVRYSTPTERSQPWCMPPG